MIIQDDDHHIFVVASKLPGLSPEKIEIRWREKGKWRLASESDAIWGEGGNISS